MTFSVSKKHDVGQRPVAALGENDVEMAVAVEVADAGVGGGFGDCFQGNRFEGADRGGGEQQGENGKQEGAHFT
jgi:hypothetical protein